MLSKLSLRGVGSGIGVVGGGGSCCWMGVATLGGCWGATLGGCGTRCAWRAVPGVPCPCHALNRSQSCAMALSWVTEVGCGALASAEAMTWRPLMILSSGDGVGFVQKAWQNSTVLEIT